MELLKKKRYRFSIEGKFLIIKKRTFFNVKTLRTIELNSIIKVSYKCFNENVNLLSKIVYFILSIVSFEIIYSSPSINLLKKYLNITYSVDGEEAIFGLNINLKNTDVLYLRSHLEHKKS